MIKKIGLLGLGLGLVLLVAGVIYLLNEREVVVDDSNSSEELIAREVGFDFWENFLMLAPPAEDAEAGERLLDLLSDRAREEVTRETLSRDMALFVGVQDVPDQGVEFEEVNMKADGSAVLPVNLNYSGGVTKRYIQLVKEDGEWKVDGVQSEES